jgi:hypothetical protein
MRVCSQAGPRVHCFACLQADVGECSVVCDQTGVSVSLHTQHRKLMSKLLLHTRVVAVCCACQFLWRVILPLLFDTRDSPRTTGVTASAEGLPWSCVDRTFGLCVAMQQCSR